MTARNFSKQPAAFTLVEVLVATAVSGIFLAALMTTWSSMSAAALNNTAYAQRQNDQMRVLDYLKRDIRRATNIELYNGVTLVTGTNIFASELRLTIPGYYSDSREEDNAIGTNTRHTPALVSGKVVYGAPLTVRYFAANGAVLRAEASALRTTQRTVGSAAGAFTLSFSREASGAIRCRVLYDQRMRSRGDRTLRRQVDTLCIPRSELLL